jgi:hypothetical protein
MLSELITLEHSGQKNKKKICFLVLLFGTFHSSLNFDLFPKTQEERQRCLAPAYFIIHKTSQTMNKTVIKQRHLQNKFLKLEKCSLVLQHGAVWRQLEVLKEYIASIFKVEE